MNARGVHPLDAGRFLVILFLVAVSPLSANAGEAVRDSTSGYLEQLQERDIESHSPELIESNPAVRDSALALLDSLGFEAYSRRAKLAMPPWDWSLLPATKLLAYDRVDGLTIGLEVKVTSNHRENLALDAQAAWATASGELRYYSDLDVPVGPVVMTGGYADRVMAYGSNHLTWNGLRALVGGSDDQDYLRRRGGWAGVRVSPAGFVTLRGVYAAAKENSVGTRGVWSLFGSLDQPNPGIQEGIMRSLDFDLEAGSIQTGRQRLALAYRLAGGGLGGDFTFNRIALTGQARRYLPGGFETLASAGWTGTGGDAPTQELADMGGISTVRGFARRTRLGEESLRGGLELFLPLDPLALTHVPILERGRVQIVLWGDAGRVWEGTSNAWLTSAGVGLQRYLGPFDDAANLRLDFAFPMGPERPDDVAVFLRFTPGMF